MLLAEMRLRLADGTVFGGAVAVVALARCIWWAWPFWLASRLPGAMRVLRAGYRALAANRNCKGGICQIGGSGNALDFLPLVVLPAIVLCVQAELPRWVFMWLLAVALFLGCKWLTWRRTLADAKSPTVTRSLAYLLAWPGMDADEFLCGHANSRPTIQAWIFATAKTVCGAALVWLAAANFFQLAPMPLGWMGMAGVVLFLHFGSFHLLALAWQSRGINAKPLMRAPLLATSLADFWGRRWNTAFHLLAQKLVFRPLARRAGVAAATVGVFLASGLVHDLVISVPAQGGYGLPTGYFLLQGVGVLCERTKKGRALGLGRGILGRIFMFVVVATPVYWLFHPIFIRNVILPMLNAIGSK